VLGGHLAAYVPVPPRVNISTPEGRWEVAKRPSAKRFEFRTDWQALCRQVSAPAGLGVSPRVADSTLDARSRALSCPALVRSSARTDRASLAIGPGWLAATIGAACRVALTPNVDQAWVILMMLSGSGNPKPTRITPRTPVLSLLKYADLSTSTLLPSRTTT
jgi:hypothetical protein